MMPVAMTLGIVLGLSVPRLVVAAGVAIPYLVASMLLVAYSKLKFRSIRITGMHVLLFAVQIIGALGVWKLMSYWNPLFAQQAFICLFCPIATSAPVVVGMLGGSLPCVVTYILFFYIGTSVLTPVLLPIVSGNESMSFIATSLTIARQVMPLILLPLLATVALKLKFKRGLVALQHHQSIGFYLWSITLTLVIGKSTTYVMAQPSSMIPTELLLTAISLVTCLLQFGVGRIIGIRYGEPVAATQSLGQKNVALGLWMIFSYMNPLISVGMAVYSIFQNTINSLQIYKYASKRQIH